MAHWMVKAAVQGMLARLPQPQRWNRLLQKYVSRSLDLDDAYFLSKWAQCVRHHRALRKYGAVESSGSFTALELGTGWFPIIPVGLALAGARVVYSIDTQDLIDHGRVVQTLERYREMIDAGRVTFENPAAGRRIDVLLADAGGASARELLSGLGIQSITGDARNLELPGHSIDLVCSNNTLEHIPSEVIAAIFCEFRRVLRATGVMCHFIDAADHYASFDRGITEYNFLRFSDSKWRLFNNQLQYQNRLRVSDFRRLHSEAGFALIAEYNASRPLEVLRSVPVAPQFRHYSEADLAVYATWMVSRAACVVS